MSLDKFSKNFLQYLNSKDNPASTLYSFSDLTSLATDLNVDEERIRSVVKYLHEKKFLTYSRDEKGKERAFYLSHMGLNWKYFRRKEILNYIADKWADVIAVVISLISLITSIVAIGQ